MQMLSTSYKIADYFHSDFGSNLYYRKFAVGPSSVIRGIQVGGLTARAEVSNSGLLNAVLNACRYPSAV